MKTKSQSGVLDGAILKYTYAELGTVIVEFYDGLTKFEWIEGPLCGQAAKDFPYLARKFMDQQYIANWHEPDAHAFVTLIIDLQNSRVYSSVLASYSTEDEEVWLHEAELHVSEGIS